MRNLVLCCDGTNNQFGQENTNVLRLVQALERDPVKQRIYYDPGVGTLPEPQLLTRVGKKLSEWWGLAFGRGLTANVSEAYSYLMDLWQPGDRVFLFGFSRGAYTVRVLAGLLHCLGLLPRGNQNLLPYVLRLFKAARRKNIAAHWKLCDEFRQTFARRAGLEDDRRHFRVHFLGVWDTVSSYGWAWNPKSFPFTRNNPSIDILRHAVSIDERRAFFRQNLMDSEGPQDLVEAWFPGVHCDVGGGYPEELPKKPGTYSRLWQPPFEWMLDAAIQAGLCVDEARRKAVLDKSPRTNTPWLDSQHESLTWKWWPAEFFPKLQWRFDLKRSVPRLGLGRRRPIQRGAMIQQAALLRIRDSAYAPTNMTEKFLKKVRALTTIPQMMPYEP